jgi:uncharacterized protein involved in exopolysaccharide biosynthesis
VVDLSSQAPTGAVAKNFDAGTPVDLQRLFGVFWRARYWLLGVAVVAAVAGVYIAKTYVSVVFSATSALIWEPKEKGLDPVEHERRLRTLVESVKIPRNLALTRERQGSAISLEQLARRLSVSVRPDSSLIHITGEGDSADAAKLLADEVSRVLVDSQIEKYLAELREQNTRFSELLAIARKETQKARVAYDVFRGKNGIIYLPSDRDQQVEQVRSLSQAARLAQVEADAQGKRAQTLAKARGELEPTVLLSEHELDAVKHRQAELQAELESLGATLSSDHPRILTLTSQVQQLTENRSSLQPVVDGRIVGRHPQLDTIEASVTSASAEQDAAATRHETLSALEARANVRLEELNQIEGRARELYAAVARTEERVSHFEQKLALIRDELSAPAIDLTVLSEANLPTFPVSSKRRTVAIAVPALALALLCVLLLVMSNRGLRAHTAREIAYWARVPVIAASSWPDKKSEHDTPEHMLTKTAAAGRSIILIPMNDSLGPVAQELGGLTTETIPSDVPDESQNLDLDGMTLEQLSSIAVLPSVDASIQDREESRCETFVEVERTSDLSLLRKRVRLAERVIVVVRSGAHSVFELRSLCSRLGRTQGMAIYVTGVGTPLANFSEQAGDVDAFFAAAG